MSLAALSGAFQPWTDARGCHVPPSSCSGRLMRAPTARPWGLACSQIQQPSRLAGASPTTGTDRRLLVLSEGTQDSSDRSSPNLVPPELSSLFSLLLPDLVLLLIVTRVLSSFSNCSDILRCVPICAKFLF
ncbi:hypothetical protein GQ457_13G009920 [Hibiscus cannabinus]